LLYKGYNETDLKMLVVHTENKSDAQSMEINRLRSEMQRKDAKVHEQSNQIVLLKAEKRMLDNQCRFRGGFGKHVSTFGGYLLARKLATSTTGAASCAQLVAGESHQGSVQCPHTVTTYVHRLSAAYRVCEAERQAEIVGTTAIEAHEVKFDATDLDAVEKEKVHASVWCTSAVTIEACSGPAELPYVVKSTKRISGDLQCVKAGNSRELYGMVQKEAASVACPTWETRVEQINIDTAAGKPPRTSMYNVGTDAGGENIGMLPMIRMSLWPTIFVMYSWIFCFMHQGHLLCKNIITVLDRWSWDGDEDRLPCPYYTGVSSISGLWRRAGHPAKILNAACELFSQVVSERYFSRVPGRVLRGRWLSIEEAEQLIILALQYIGQVFLCVWGAHVAADDKKKAAAAKAKAKAAAAAVAAKAKGKAAPAPKANARANSNLANEEAAAFSAIQHSVLLNATRSAASSLFGAMLVASSAAKQPVVHFMAWMQKSHKEVRAQQAEEESAGRTYMGPTTLSALAAGGWKKFRSEMTALFDQHDVMKGGFGGMWELLPERQHDRGRELIVSMLLVELAAFDFRFVLQLTSLPLQFMILCEKGPDVEDGERVELAKYIVDTDDDELLNLTLLSDMPYKVKQIYLADFRFIIDNNGKCPLRLWVFSAVYRSRMPHESQEVEGFNSIISKSRGKLPLVSDKLRNKVALVPLGTSECVALHPGVLEFLNSPDITSRWAPCSDYGVVPIPLIPKDMSLPADKLAFRYAQAFQQIDHDRQAVRFVWTFTKPNTTTNKSVTAFIVCWYHGYVPFVATGVVQFLLDSFRFKFDTDYPTCRVTCVFLQRLYQRVDPFSEAPIQVHRFRLQWKTLQSPVVDKELTSSFNMKPAPKRAPRARPPAPADDDDTLEQDLGDLLDMFLEVPPLEGDLHGDDDEPDGDVDELGHDNQPPPDPPGPPPLPPPLEPPPLPPAVEPPIDPTEVA